MRDGERGGGSHLPAELGQYEECFVTNSLMGIMPVNQLGEWKSESREVTNQLLKKYESI